MISLAHVYIFQHMFGSSRLYDPHWLHLWLWLLKVLLLLQRKRLVSHKFCFALQYKRSQTQVDSELQIFMVHVP